MIFLSSCMPWNIQHDRSRSVRLLWNADVSLLRLFMWFKAVMEAEQQGPERQAGHDNEAEILQKLLRLLAGQGGVHRTTAARGKSSSSMCVYAALCQQEREKPGLDVRCRTKCFSFNKQHLWARCHMFLWIMSLTAQHQPFSRSHKTPHSFPQTLVYSQFMW